MLALSVRRLAPALIALVCACALLAAAASPALALDAATLRALESAVAPGAQRRGASARSERGSTQAP